MKKSKLPLFLFLGTLIGLAIVTGLWDLRLSRESVSSSPRPRLFTIQHALNSKSVQHASTSQPPASAAKTSATDNLDLIVRVIVSLSVLAASLFVILGKKYDVDDKKWAYSSVGAILGFWLGG